MIPNSQSSVSQVPPTVAGPRPKSPDVISIPTSTRGGNLPRHRPLDPAEHFPRIWSSLQPAPAPSPAHHTPHPLFSAVNDHDIRYPELVLASGPARMAGRRSVVSVDGKMNGPRLWLRSLVLRGMQTCRIVVDVKVKCRAASMMQSLDDSREEGGRRWMKWGKVSNAPCLFTFVAVRSPGLAPLSPLHSHPFLG